jgi:hypothetical protein
MADFEGFSKRKMVTSFTKAFLENFTKLKSALGRAGHPKKPLIEKRDKLNQIANQLSLKIAKDKKNKNTKRLDSDKRILETVIKDRERLNEAERSLVHSGVGKNIKN